MRIAKVADGFKGIDRIETTDELLTSRAGMAVLSSYVHKTNIGELLAHLNPVKVNRKGTRDVSVYHQILMFLMEGSSSSLEYFNTLADDEAYRACIGVAESKTISTRLHPHEKSPVPNRPYETVRRATHGIPPHGGCARYRFRGLRQR
jgi:hypothetical protein